MGILSNLVLILIIALVLFGVTLPVWYVLWLVQESDAGRTAKDEKSGTDICVHEMNMVRH